MENKITQHIKQANHYLAQILVNDVAVDLMALARQELREALRLASEIKEENDG